MESPFIKYDLLSTNAVKVSADPKSAETNPRSFMWKIRLGWDTTSPTRTSKSWKSTSTRKKSRFCWWTKLTVFCTTSHRLFPGSKIRNSRTWVSTPRTSFAFGTIWGSRGESGPASWSTFWRCTSRPWSFARRLRWFTPSRNSLANSTRMKVSKMTFLLWFGK